MNMRLLAGTEIHQAVNALATRGGDIDIAVAYCGQDSLDRTGIASKRNGRLRLIYDPLSGSCNPGLIAALRQDGIAVKARLMKDPAFGEKYARIDKKVIVLLPGDARARTPSPPRCQEIPSCVE